MEGQRDQKGQQQQDHRPQLSEMDPSQRNLTDLHVTFYILHLTAVKSFYDSINVFCNGFSCCHFCLFLCALCNSGISHICFIQCYLFFEVSEFFSGQSIFFAPAYILKLEVLIFLKAKNSFNE